MVVLLFVLNMIGGVGYHIYTIKENSFIRYPIFGYADVVFYCDIMYNPLSTLSIG